jgi:hypothetical protein
VGYSIDVEAIRQANDLVALVEKDAGRGIRRGGWLMFRCPLHSDDDPSFGIDNTRQHFRCFGCNRSGDVIDYVQFRDDVGFKEACRRLNGGDASLSPETIAYLKASRERHEDKKQEKRRAKLAQFTSQELWEELHERMAEENKLWWEQQGIPRVWQDYLHLGFTPEKSYYGNDKQLLTSPAYTIPYFHYNFRFQTMQYRLVNPQNPKDRYRFENNLQTTYYMTTPNVPIDDKVIVCEGAKKAIVATAYGGGNGATVLAIPSKSDFGNIVDALKNCGRVYIILDPDCWEKPEYASSDWLPAPVKMAKEIGGAARIVEAPMKIDDAFVKYGLTQRDFETLLRQSVKGD